MKYLKLIAAVALIGGTAAACVDDGNYSGRGQYGYNTAPDRNRDGIPDNQQRPRADADRDGVPNYRDRAPNNPYYR